MSTGPDKLISALVALGEQLDYAGVPRTELVVCGGTALNVLGLVNRVTSDVDVIALAQTDEVGCVRLLPTTDLPAEVVRAAGTVARDLGLRDDWLNAVAARAGQSLPERWADRLHTVRYGDRLVVHFVGKFDQICLKLHAVVDRSAESVHLADLKALRPSSREMVAAARWCVSQDAGPGFRAFLKSCLERIGYPDAARSLENRLP